MEHTAYIEQVRLKMQEFDRGSAERIQHFTKVHSFARQIGILEELPPETQLVLELTALLHDIGIGPSEKVHGYCNGAMQEEAGPPFAQEILQSLELPTPIIQRVCYLIAHHHSYDNVDGLDYRILLEADFLVNLHENQVPPEGIRSAYEKIFQSKSGRQLCSVMFDLD